ncbi:LAMI_0H16952g1_1 [Lachancea mirantina]|uniref:U6 snRNA phosphodiesterase 1 n=1 Tax=Lachancea mirantina TaxID=1230905 RepID=A0A1G4KJ74_9SACH|nr:LAMI_0H16952g1_1 [Lachancea mirantina]
MELLQSNYTNNSSSSGSEDENSGETIRSEPLPKPFEVFDKYQITPNVKKYITNAEMNFTKGRWTSFVFIEFRNNATQRAALDKLLPRINELLRPVDVEFKSLYTSELGSPQPLHISLSSNIEFSTSAELDRFSRMLTVELRQKLTKGFDVAFGPQLRVHANSDKTALFLTMECVDTVRCNQISLISSVVHEAVDYCAAEEPNSKNMGKLDPALAHMSVGIDTTSRATRNSTLRGGSWSDFFGLKLTEVNTALASLYLDADFLRMFQFHCGGVKITKQRANIWVPFE